MNLDQFYQKYPADTEVLTSGKNFTYRYYNNPEAAATLVLLTGGTGLSDLLYLHFDRFARDFSVLMFDYQIQFADNGEFASAVAELLRRRGAPAQAVRISHDRLSRGRAKLLRNDPSRFRKVERQSSAPSLRGRQNFYPDCKESLIDIMSDPTVVTHLTGGRLALLVRLEQYADLVTEYIKNV